MPLTSTITADFAGTSKDTAVFEAVVVQCGQPTMGSVTGSATQNDELVVTPTAGATGGYNGYSLVGSESDPNVLDFMFVEFKEAALTESVSSGSLMAFAVGHRVTRTGHSMTIRIQRAFLDGYRLICEYNYFGDPDTVVNIAYVPADHRWGKIVDTGSAIQAWVAPLGADPLDTGAYTLLYSTATDPLAPPYEAFSDCSASFIVGNFGGDPGLGAMSGTFDNLNTSGAAGPTFQPAWAARANQVIGAL